MHRFQAGAVLQTVFGFAAPRELGRARGSQALRTKTQHYGGVTPRLVFTCCRAVTVFFATFDDTASKPWV